MKKKEIIRALDKSHDNQYLQAREEPVGCRVEAHAKTPHENETTNSLLFENRINEILTIDELAKILKVSVSGIYKMVHRKKIPYLKFGSALRFNLKDVLASLKRG